MNAKLRQLYASTHRSILLGLLAVGFAGFLATPVVAQGQSDVDLSIGATQYPDDDAIFLRWDQHYTLKPDGAVHRQEHRWVKLMNNRPIRRFGDPRIPHVADSDQLIIHTAQSILPDGTVLPVPDYSFNNAATDAVAGWPEYAGWQDMIVSFSGIEPGVVLELDYEVITPAGAKTWLADDLRLDDEYPVVERVVSVTVPSGKTLNYKFDRADKMKASLKESTLGGAKTYLWSTSRLPGDRNEDGAFPWSMRSPRLRFTTCPDTAQWVQTLTQRIVENARPDDGIKKFAEDAIELETDPAEQLRKLSKKIRDTFNIVGDIRAMRGLHCRPAADVFCTNYGNALEATAYLKAAVASLGFDGNVMVGVDADRWVKDDAISPTLNSYAGAVVSVAWDGGSMNLHPQHGEVRNPGSWGRHTLLSARDGKVESTYVTARGEREGSQIRIAGKISVDKDAVGTGEIRIHATGDFYDPAKLDTSDAQEEWVKEIVGRVLSEFDVSGSSIVTLSEDALRATAQVTTKEPIKDLAGQRIIRLGDGPALQGTYHLPTSRSYRRTDVRVGGKVRENVDLAVELPEGWKATIVPADYKGMSAPWGTASQTVKMKDRTLQYSRAITIGKDSIPPSEFNTLREALLAMQSNASLTFAFTKEK